MSSTASFSSFYRSLFESIPAACLVVDQAGKLLGENRAASDQFGSSGAATSALRDHPAWQQMADRAREQLDRWISDPSAPLRAGEAHVHEIADEEGSLHWARVSSWRKSDGSPAELLLVVLEDMAGRQEKDDARSRKRERLRALANERVHLEELERRRIARGLHDDVGQTLASAKLLLGKLARPTANAAVEPGFAEIAALLDHAMQASRSLTFELSPPVLSELGLKPAIQCLGERMTRETGLGFELHCASSVPRLANEFGGVFYRIARELLRNAAKHASAKVVSVSLAMCDDDFELVVEDDGVGIQAASEDRNWDEERGFGLFSIREELDQLAWPFEVGARPGGGTRIRVLAPVVIDREEER